MRARFIRAAVMLASLGVTVSLSSGCELLVQLDRSAVEVDDAGCPICADGGDDGDDASDATPTTDGDDGGTTADDAESTADGGTED